MVHYFKKNLQNFDFLSIFVHIFLLWPVFTLNFANVFMSVLCNKLTNQSIKTQVLKL